MGAGTQMTPASLKMRVNRKVIETRCEICRAGYSLGDEVYPCELCHAYHHAHCLESGQTCPKGIVIPPDPVSFAIKSSALAEPELASSPATQVSWTCPSCGLTNRGSASRCDCGYIFESAVAQLKPTDSALAEDERRCPNCSKVIKREAMKCRFCGEVLEARLQAQFDAEVVPSNITADIESNANKSLTLSIIGIFICAPITEPIAISRGNTAINLLKQYPGYAGNSSAGTKARAGIIIGWIALALFAITLFARLSQI